MKTHNENESKNLYFPYTTCCVININEISNNTNTVTIEMCRINYLD